MIRGLAFPGTRLVVLILALLSTATAALCQPSIVSQHFEVYDHAGAGLSYLRAVADAMEEALAAVAGHGASLAKPCSGMRYVVNVVQVPSGERGFTKSHFRVDQAGRVVEACIAWVNISAGLPEVMLKAVAHHELVHVAQASYVRYASVAQARPWYVEASSEGFGSALSGVCVWIPYYFTYGLYRYNPYRFFGTDTRCYALGAFYYWVLAADYSRLDAALRGSFSGESVVSSWVNSAYLDYLIAVAKGIVMCGIRYEPEFTRVYLPGGAWSTTLTLDGLSAVYFRIDLPAPGPVLVSATGDLRSNIALGQPFLTQNNSLLVALVNPWLEPTTINLTIHYRPPLEARVIGGVYDGWGRTLEASLYVLYAGRPVTGLIDVDGVPVEASNGYAKVVLHGVSWGRYTLKVSYSWGESRVQVNVARPAASLITVPTLYLTPGGRGEIRVAFRNSGDVSVKARVMLEAPPFIRAEPLAVDVPSGEASIGLPFSVNSTPIPAASQLRVCYATDDCAELRLTVAPVELRAMLAHYDFAANTTRVEAWAEPVNLHLTATLGGLWGTAWFRYSTYYVGCLNVSLPPPSVELDVSPVLVASSWLILKVNATVKAVDPHPALNVSYSLQVIVNGVRLGSVDFAYGEVRTLSSLVNLTYTGARLTLEGPFVMPLVLQVPKPVLKVEDIVWLVDDDGSSVNVKVSVSGSSRFVVLGIEVLNETLTLERRLEKGVTSLTLDFGFEVLHFEMPKVKLELRVPPVALAGSPVEATLILRTAARVNATVAVLLEGEEVERLRLTKFNGDAARARVTLIPPSPGVYSVTARAWFTNASASFLYIRVLRLAVEAPRLALVGSRAPIRAVLTLEPPVTTLVSVTVRGCGPELELELEANSTAFLSFSKVCRAILEARLLNYTASTTMYWDVLTLTFERVLGRFEGGLVVPNGTLKPVALFANATLAPATVLVDGQPNLVLRKPGSYIVKLEAELLGARNETTATVYAVPEELYISTIELLRELGEPSHLASALKLAVLSGRWERIRAFVDTYSSAKRATPEPLATLAAALTERWAMEGNEAYLNAAQVLLALRPAAYLTLIVVTAVLFARGARRKPREASRTQSEEAQQPSSCDPRESTDCRAHSSSNSTQLPSSSTFSLLSTSLPTNTSSLSSSGSRGT